MNNLTAYSPSLIQRLRWWTSSSRRRFKTWLTQRALDAIVLLNKDSNYISHVRREVPSWFKGDGPNRWMADGTVELLAVLSHQGHSGSSIGFAALQFFSAMARLKPWGPLTGADDEWSEPYDSEGSVQNRRCSHVFKGSDGRAYDINGRVFREPDGCCYTNKESRVFVEFPYTPKTEYVDVAAQQIVEKPS